ncbi:helix-turn-helix domain-containing protein [Rhizobiales bacterium Sp-1]|uniref:Helix-turn-helix domain-containing protein n=1 Tax=Segnochrobactrum spirostomi TaxID=2608987 RepID=A0A6A7Y7Z8_9HYPH|nr:helix-turn-helix domain-containing protein [Segnochrobactrum spirostomi]
MARSFVHLSLEERRVIARMHGEKSTQAEIARTLRRDRSTICRELRRHVRRQAGLFAGIDLGLLQSLVQ